MSSSFQHLAWFPDHQLCAILVSSVNSVLVFALCCFILTFNGLYVLTLEQLQITF